MEIIITVVYLHIIIYICDKLIKMYHKRRQQWIDPVKGKKLLKKFGPTYMDDLTERVIILMAIKDRAEQKLQQLKEDVRNTNPLD